VAAGETLSTTGKGGIQSEQKVREKGGGNDEVKGECIEGGSKKGGGMRSLGKSKELVDRWFAWIRREERGRESGGA